MALAPGTRLGPYEILSALGAGGMGEVWKAWDTRVDRLVAIKTSHSRFSERFEREARAIAAVNHPHVCSLFDVGRLRVSDATATQGPEVDFLVMEYVEGESLCGPVPLSKALTLAGQILDALDAAHQKGIVHRDLKPGNILLTKSGVKVLDFGLAKVQRSDVESRGGAETQTEDLTAAGSVMGTLPYMSPEQIEGRDADARSDLFAFGVVLYELIAGARPFTGQTQASLVASILKEEPRPLIEVQPRTPRGVAEVVRTCLEKDREQRWQSAREVRHALKWMAAEAPPSVPARSVRVWQGLAAVMALIALGIGGWALFRPSAPGPIGRFEAPVPENVPPYDDVTVSPDGRTLVFAAAGRDGLWLRDLGEVEWRRLPGTEDATTLFWSPDSRHVAFTVDNQLRKIDVRGGPPETVSTLPAPVRSGTWNRNGDILLGSWGGGSGGPIWRVSHTGGAARAVTQVDGSRGEFTHTWPTFLPDGTHFLYFRSGPPDVEGTYVGSLDGDPAGQSRERLLISPAPALYANGYVLFVRASTLMAQGFDARRLELHGEPVPVAENVMTTWFSTGVFSVSGTGVLAYRTAAAPGPVQLTWLDRHGKTLRVLGPPGTDASVALSPDGKRAVVKDAPYGVPGDLWMIDVASGQRARLTFRKQVYSDGVWSSDGVRIAYSAGDLGDTLCERAASGLGDEQVLWKEPGLRFYPTSWSSDGRFLLYHTENAPRTGYDLWALSLRDRKPYRLLGETFNEWAGFFSPDMRWVAYVSLETATVGQVYVRPFRVSEPAGQPSLGQGQWQVSKSHGNWPEWRRASEIVFNNAPNGTAVFAAPVNTSGTAFQSEVPQRLPFPANVRLGTPDMTPDGQQFLVVALSDPRPARPSISVVLNWPASLKQ